MLSVIILSVVMLSFIMLSVIMLSVVMLSVIVPSVVMLSVFMLSVIMLSAIILSVIMLSVIMLSVVVPSAVATDWPYQPRGEALRHPLAQREKGQSLPSIISASCKTQLMSYRLKCAHRESLGEIKYWHNFTTNWVY
jgi:hypothetical protein